MFKLLWHTQFHYHLFSLLQAVFIGMMISSSLWGNVSDKYGRKTVSSNNASICHRGDICFLIRTLSLCKVKFSFCVSKRKWTCRHVLDMMKYCLSSSLACLLHVHTQGLKMSVLWTMFYGLMSAFAPVYGWILVLRALVGFGIGGAPQSWVTSIHRANLKQRYSEWFEFGLTAKCFSL